MFPKRQGCLRLFASFGMAAIASVAVAQDASIPSEQSVDSAVAEPVADSPEKKQGDWILADNRPIVDLTKGLIDNRRVYQHFMKRGQALLEDDRIFTDREMILALEAAPRTTPRTRKPVEPVAKEAVFERCRQASMVIGCLYDCGRCSQIHANLSGGVVISEDGLVLTNYHVLVREEGKVKGLVAMNHQGECFAIAEVLAASKSADVALIRVASDRPLQAIPMAMESPKPLTPVFVISHPHNEFYTVSTGVVSRLAKSGMPGDSATWLEITAEFSGGSSGSGIFDASGQLVGLVSRIHPLFRMENGNGARNGASSQPPAAGVPKVFVEQILRRCVPVEAIHGLWEATER
ncbi:MAG: serine protease [Pirellula sp.]